MISRWKQYGGRSRGSAGPDGLPATVDVGTTTTLSPGASATVTNVGTPSNVILDFGIPAGVAGSNGANGADGARGSLWFEGAGAPSASALPNDMYLDHATGDVWVYV